MMAVAPAYQDILNKAQTMELLGEVITWDLKEYTSVSFSDLQQALRVHGLDEKALRKLLPRYAWSRAAKKMEEGKIIRFIAEADNKLAFQFTKEYKDTQLGQINYDREAKLYLTKDTGDIQVESDVLTDQERQELAQKASQMLADAMENRTTADVTNIIKRLFGKAADLFPLRSAGGVYFVPLTHSEFVDRVSGLVNHLGGNMTRFPVPAGTQHGDKSVKEAVTEGMQRVVQEFADAVTTFGTDTRPSTVTKALERVQQAEFKVEAYQMYLDEEAQKLTSTLGMIRAQMKQKLQDIWDAKKSA